MLIRHSTHVRTGRRLLAGAAVIAMAYATPLSAQTADPTVRKDAAVAPDDPADGQGVPDIVVTARFRRESVQSTPAAITVLSTGELAARGVQTMSDLAGFTPNVTIQPSPANSGKSAFTLIRGVGQTDSNFAFEPGVAIYLDEMYLGTVFGSQLDLMDTGRVEVLRGPQGTLFGRNSEGGAIRISSVEPGGDNSGYLEAGYGSFDHLRLRAAVDLGLVPDRVMLRIAGGINKSDGFVDRIDFACANSGLAGNLKPTTNAPGCKVGTLGGENTRFVQGTLRLKPADGLTIDIRGSYLDDQGENVPQTLLQVGATAPGVAEALAFLNARYVADPRIGIPFDNRFATGSFYTTYDAPSNLLSNKTYANRAPVESWSASGIVNWEIAPGTTLHSVTAYQSITDPGSAPLSTGGAYFPQKHRQFSQELSLSSSAGILGRQLEWTVGGFLFNGDDRTLGFNDIDLVPTTGLHFDLDDPSSNRSRSLFAHVLYHATDKLGIEVGYRRSFEKKRYDFNHYITAPSLPFQLPAGTPFIIGGTTSSTKRGDPRIAVTYQWTPAVLTYASYATGYKSGGVNPRPLTPTDIVPFGPETLKAYEAGIKTSSFDRKLIVNAAVYQSDYKGLQISASTGGTVPTFRYSNVGSARIRGFEVELDARPVPRLSLDAAIGYTHFKILDLGAAEGVAGGPTLDSKPILVPAWKGTAGIQYELPLGTAGILTPRLDVIAQSAVYTDAPNQPQGRIASRGLLNARIAWRSPSKAWTVSMNATNLLDKKYYLNKQYELNTIGTFRAQPGRPREIMLTMRRDF